MHPQTDLMIMKKTGFFDALEKAYDKSPRYDFKIFLGNFNAQVGEEAINFPTVGNYIIHNLTNDNVRNISTDTVYSIVECDYRINIPPKSKISIRERGGCLMAQHSIRKIMSQLTKDINLT